MLDVLQTIKDEVLDDDFIARCKYLIENMGQQTATVVFVCNSKEATRYLLTIPTQMMKSQVCRGAIKHVAQKAQADAILSMVTCSNIEGQVCMTISVETLLNRYAVVYPYERRGPGLVDWKEPIQMEFSNRYGDLLPAPAGMARA